MYTCSSSPGPLSQLFNIAYKNWVVYRRASYKRSLLHAVLMDIVDALDKLDIDHSIPLIFCEAADLLKLPPLCTSNSTVPNESSKAVLSSL